jgi:hypothetical protein
MSVERLEFWVMVCTTEGCVANGHEYPTDSKEIECGGCNAVYTKPE